VNSSPEPRVAPPRLELSVLGRLDLRTPTGEVHDTVLGQPKRLALLLYLVLAPPHTLRRRDLVAAMFWPEDDEEHARGSLRQAVRFLRRELGPDAVIGRGDEEIGVDPDRLWCDALAFEAAVSRGDVEEAARLYRGDLLEGFHAGEVAPEFEEWIEQLRGRLRRSAAGVLGTLADRSRAGGAVPEAISIARRAVALAADDEGAHRRLIGLLDQTGDRAGAIAAYEALARRLKADYAADPSAETQALIKQVRSRAAPHLVPEPERPVAESSRGPVPQAESASRRSSRLAVPLFSTIVILLVGGYLFARSRGDRPARPGDVGIAVLPVQLLSGDSSQGPLADGMTDELITDLAQIARLRVINRRTMMGYQGRRISPDSTALVLGVDWVVTSTLQLQGDQAVYRAQLVRAGDPATAGAVTLTGSRGRSLEWQQEVARKVAEWTRIKLKPAEQAGLAARREIDPQALDLYARGRWWWNKRGRQGLTKADQFFHQALDFEPAYAPIWSALADTYAQIGYGGFLPPDEAFGKSKAMARRALELDPTLAEPHAALGYALMYFDWNWPEAEREFRLAIARNPSYATAHEWYGLFLAAMGRFSEAESEGRTAQELDPLSAAVAGTRGWILHYAGKEAEALAVLRGGVRTDSTNSNVQLYLGRVHQALGQLDSATAHYLATGPLRSWIPTVAGEAVVAALDGHAAEARRAIQRLDSLGQSGEYVTPYAVALVYTALGNKDSAFARLEQGYRDRTHWLVWLRRDSRWQSLRGDPRYLSLVQRIGLPK
jgi:DNA-binding SARP family transcriptional activator/TolB-like protein